MVILKLIFIKIVIQLYKVKLSITDKLKQYIYVIRKTEVIFMIKQIRLKTFLSNKVNRLKICNALTVQQA